MNKDKDSPEVKAGKARLRRLSLIQTKPKISRRDTVKKPFADITSSTVNQATTSKPVTDNYYQTNATHKKLGNTIPSTTTKPLPPFNSVENVNDNIFGGPFSQPQTDVGFKPNPFSIPNTYISPSNIITVVKGKSTSQTPFT